MFTFQALEEDFFSVFKQTSAAQMSSRQTPEQLCTSMTEATTARSTISLDSILLKISTAWSDLDVLRKRVSSSSISIRAPAVTLMANEAILWSTMESIAAAFSPRALQVTQQQLPLGKISNYLWSMVDSRITTSEVDVSALSSSSGPPFTRTLRIPASHRNARTEFERQRLVYSGILSFLASEVGVQDHRAPRISAWLVWAVIEILGFDALYHVDVWRAWQYPEARCMSTRLWTKEPTLDVLIHLLGHLRAPSALHCRPASVLAGYSLQTCTDVEEQRALDSERLFETTAQDALRWELVAPPVVQPLAGTKIYRALALASELIGMTQ